VAGGGQSLTTEIVGSLLWSAALAIVFCALAARRYRRR
jgi:hypothetical protein